MCTKASRIVDVSPIAQPATFIGRWFNFIARPLQVPYFVFDLRRTCRRVAAGREEELQSEKSCRKWNSRRRVGMNLCWPSTSACEWSKKNLAVTFCYRDKWVECLLKWVLLICHHWWGDAPTSSIFSLYYCNSLGYISQPAWNVTWTQVYFVWGWFRVAIDWKKYSFGEWRSAEL
jgi:hypothetical protein